MASVSAKGKKKGGEKRVLFVAPDGSRKTIYLGKLSMEDARLIARYVQALTDARIGGLTPSNDVVAWLSGIGESLRAKLVKAGLVDCLPAEAFTSAVAEPLTLGRHIENYFERRRDVKPSTLQNWKHTQRCLLEYFGSERMLSSINTAEAKDWQRWLRGGARKNRYEHREASEGLAPATAGKRVKNACQFFEDARERGMLERNPFAGLKCDQQANKQRQFFVTREMAFKVMDCIPDNEWKLIFSLARFAGLRTPSETLTLRWQDIHWGENKMVVTVPKLEHHEGKGTRLIPIFPEVKPYLEAAWSEASPGSVYVIQRYRKSANLRTQLRRYIISAGLKPWPKVFTNLRSSMATELVERFPSHIESEWVGHSTKIAKEHYLQVTQSDFDRASGGLLKTTQNPTHKTTQQGGELGSMGMQADSKYAGNHQKSGVFQGGAGSCSAIQSEQMGAIGVVQSLK